MTKTVLKKCGFNVLVLFLLFFMILIFGPAEIYFANVGEFEFLYTEFAGYLALAAVAVSVLGGGFLYLLPEKLYKLILSIVFGIILVGYIQIMFLNKRLDLLGENPMGYQVDKQVAILNLLIWCGVIGVVIGIAYYKPKLWNVMLGYGSAFLLAIQLVALFSLVFTAEDAAYRREDGEWHLTGENQFVVSADENVIVLVLDYYSNQYIESTQKLYPDMIDFLHDFTYYTNANADYFGTFPSMISTFANVDLEPSISTNQWSYESWTNEDTVEYYNEVKSKGYVCNMFSTGDEHLCCENSREILKGIFSNVVNSSQTVDVFYKLLFKTMTKMSLYRMMPEIVKPLFYTDASEYTNVVGYEKDTIVHSNYEFYAKLIEDGLSVSKDGNYFIVQHLSGGHEFTNDAACMYQEHASLEDTYMGAMVLVEEYLSQLKELGVYDDATIIVTSDHGDPDHPQVIFFVKEAGEVHEEMRFSSAPITLRELLPTIGKVVGIDYEKYGRTIYDFSENEKRERYMWVRSWDERYNDSGFVALESQCNVYKVYGYVGELEDLQYKIENDICEIYPMANSFY